MSDVPVKMLEWTPEYSVHVAELDRDHQKLFDTVDRLYEALMAGKGTDLVGAIPMELTNLISDHFAHEEQMMAAARYPGFLDHVQEHDQLRAQIKAFWKRAGRGEETVTLDLTILVAEKLRQHTLTTDRRLGEYLNSRETLPGGPGVSLRRRDPFRRG